MSIDFLNTKLLASETQARGDIGFPIHTDLFRWLRQMVDAIPERLIATPIKTEAYTARAWDLILLNATDGAFSIQFPSGPKNGTEIAVSETDGSGNAVTLSAGDNDTIMGDTDYIVDTANEGSIFVYDTATQDWRRLG